jgi:hypothetical protein
MPNPFAKTRPQEKPYAIYRNNQGWEWRVLKTYKMPKSEAKDPYARWFVAATSPLMHDGQYEMGDTYAAEIKKYGQLVLADDGWMEAYAK